MNSQGERALDAASIGAALSEVAPLLEGLERLYAELGDRRSRDMLVKLLTFRVVGPSHCRLPLDTPSHWKRVETANRDQLVRARTFAIPLLDGWLNLFDLRPNGVDLRLHAHLLNVVSTFLLEQYRYRGDGFEVAVNPGDTVIDGGACWGDTAVYFANRCGPKGRVYAFEFEPANLQILDANLQLAAPCREWIEVVPRPLWDTAGKDVAFQPYGPGTRVSDSPATDASKARTQTIDGLVTESGIRKIDFIKLDIEGAELKALQGAESALRTHRPDLAIALYHELEDFSTIPDYLRSLDLGYAMYLDHFTTHVEETVLFATARARLS